MKPGMTVEDIPHMSGRIADMEDGSSVAEFAYPANRSSFYDKEEIWKNSLEKMTGVNHAEKLFAEKLLLSFDELMTCFETEPVALKTV